ncbi:MAG: hypothetical protein EBT51_12745, partial [Flavobacteriaceae bacterium]|nr:hypothetical protein [Flavobacteriaceae bacterium]
MDNTGLTAELQAFLDDDTIDSVTDTPKEIDIAIAFDCDLWLEKIKEAKAEALKKTIPAEIAALPITIPASDRGIIIKAYQDRYKELFDARIAKPDVVSLLVKRKPKAVKTAQGGQWFDNWIWITDQSKFLHKGKKKLVTKDSFNVINGNFIPEGESGQKPSATKFIADHGLVEVADGITYMPSCNDLIVHLDGQKLVNTYNEGLGILPAETYCEGGAA